MKIFSHNDILAIEKATIRERGISHDEFIAEAGRKMGYEILGAWKKGLKIVIFAGPALNGAYALSAALELAQQGAAPSIYLFNVGGDKLTAECRAAKDRLENSGLTFELVEFTGITFSMPELGKSTLVIDGIFGSELISALPRGYQQLVRNINESHAQIISLELPSGLPADSAVCLISRNVIHAHITIDLGLPRLSFFMPENYCFIGEWRSIDMEFSQQAMRQTEERYFLVEERDVRRILPLRDPGASKADFGNALLIAGSRGMAGASLLAVRAALRSGCGKVTCHGPESSRLILQSQAPDAMFHADASDSIVTDMRLDHHYDCVGAGPGLGTADATLNALEDFLKISSTTQRQLVLDADALNCISLRHGMMDYLPPLTVITPHAGEFDRLFGNSPSSEARLQKAMEMAEYYKIIIVLKGPHPAIVRPARRVFFNPTGTPAMATGGTGDVLTGLITGLIASHVRPEKATVIGVYIHGLAGEIAEDSFGPYSVTASDVANSIGRAFKEGMK